MNSIVLIGIFAAVGVLSVGYLNNDISLWLQEFGVGEGIIMSPVEATELSLQIDEVDTPDGPADLITACEFTSIDTDLLPGTKIYCKLLDFSDIKTASIIATGFIELENFVPMNTLIPITINEFSFIGSNNVDFVQNVLIEIQES